MVILWSYNNSPLSQLINGGIESYVLARSRISERSASLTTLSENLPILFTLLSQAEYLIRKTKESKVLMVLCIALYCLYALTAGSTGSLAFIALGLMVQRFIIRGVVISASLVVTFLLMIFGFFVLFKIDGDILIVANYISQRVFFDQSKALYLSLQLFPEMAPHIGVSSVGKSIQSIIFDRQITEDYGVQIMRYFNPAAVTDENIGHFTSIYVTEVYSNFGFAGVSVAPMWMGFVFRMVDSLYTERKANVVRLATSAYLIVFGLNLFSGFKFFYYPVSIFLSLAVFYVILRVCRVVRKERFF
jgi:hypothetical protein